MSYKQFLTQQVLQSISIPATAALADIYRFIGFDGKYAEANKSALGVLQYAAADKEMASVATAGIVVVEAAAAIAVGKAVVSNAVGKALAATDLSVTIPEDTTPVTSDAAQPTLVVAGSAAPQVILGYALDEATADGDIIRIKLA